MDQISNISEENQRHKNINNNNNKSLLQQKEI